MLNFNPDYLEMEVDFAAQRVVDRIIGVDR